MPSRATRGAELHQHYARSTHRPADLARALYLHPDWPLCTICQWPIDPAAGGDGTQHPNCEQP
jgi:hypothetical protein